MRLVWHTPGGDNERLHGFPTLSILQLYPCLLYGWTLFLAMPSSLNLLDDLYNEALDVSPTIYL